MAKSCFDGDLPPPMVGFPSVAKVDGEKQGSQKGGSLQIHSVQTTALTPYRRNARRHSKKQIAQIAESIRRFGFNSPVIADGSGEIIAGHGRVAAAKLLGMQTVPVIVVQDLSDAEKRAYALAENKIAENSGWDREMLAIELGELGAMLPELGIELGTIGFDAAEVDAIVGDFAGEHEGSPDVVPPRQAAAVSQPRDVWRLGRHRLMCGDARDATAFKRLLGSHRAAMVFTDPPYNVPIAGHVKTRRRVRHREFAEGSGEMSSASFTQFLSTTLSNAAHFSVDGSIHFVCMDWRHLSEIIEAGRSAYTELKNLCVWVKSNSGQGTFYRSQHELVFVFKSGDGSHQNNFELGQHGRTRTNVWKYAGVNSFRAGRNDELAMHPTVKPVAMVIDALKDCSQRGDVVLDPFVGSGTTIIAAEQVGRCGYGIEVDPQYVDVAIRRWQSLTKDDAVLEDTHRTFDEAEYLRRPRQEGQKSPGDQSVRRRRPS